MTGARAIGAALEAVILSAAVGACSAVPSPPAENAAPARSPATVIQPIARPAPAPAAPTLPAGPTTFVFAGELTQGGWLRGQAPVGAKVATLDGQPLVLDAQSRFFAAFDRDAGPRATLSATLADGRTVTSPITISPRDWQIEHVNIARSPGGASEAFMAIRRPELAQIEAARARDSAIEGWKQDFVWPAKGRISGRFGSQRVYRGEPGSYHSGIDIATGGSGAPFVAPADGVVVLAAEQPFSLEGHLIIIDHGGGLNSAFLHCSKIAVSEGQIVRQGQYIGNIGASGRATGPHLHWSLKWRDSRLDPLLFTGPMP